MYLYVLSVVVRVESGILIFDYIKYNYFNYLD